MPLQDIYKETNCRIVLVLRIYSASNYVCNAIQLDSAMDYNSMGTHFVFYFSVGTKIQITIFLLIRSFIPFNAVQLVAF